MLEITDRDITPHIAIEVDQNSVKADDRVLVEGVNRVTKHLRAGQNNNGSTEGGRQVVEAPIHLSNVAVVDPETKKPTRVGYRFETVQKNGEDVTVKVRFAKASGKEL